MAAEGLGGRTTIQLSLIFSNVCQSLEASVISAPRTIFHFTLEIAICVSCKSDLHYFHVIQ